jgi:hypothetical protein
VFPNRITIKISIAIGTVAVFVFHTSIIL